MKLKMFFATLLLVTTSALFAQDSHAGHNHGEGEDHSNAEQSAEPGKTYLKFENLVHDFGEIERGEKVTHVFKFQNISDETIEIKDVKPSCGCTSAAPEKTVYQAAEHGEIPVTFDSERFSDEIVKRVTVTLAGKENAPIFLTIKGKIVVDVVARPASLFMPKVKRNNPSTQEIMVSTERLNKLEVTKLSAEPDFIEAVLERVDDKNMKIKVTVDGSKLPKDKKRLSGAINFETNSKSQTKMRTGVTINIEDPITIKPRPSVYFYGSKQGQKREMVLRFNSSENEKLELSEVVSDLEFVSVEMLPDEANNANGKSMKVTLLENAAKGRFSGKITMKTNISEQPTISIPVRGAVN